MKPKNLLVFHLESISNTILWQYRVELGTLWRLMQESLCYSRHYVAATSTMMSQIYFQSGDASLYDFRAHYKQLPPDGHFDSLRKRYREFMEYLTDAGEYIFREHAFNVLCNRDFNPYGNTFLFADMERMHTATGTFFSEMKQSDKPFYLYVNNCISHMAFDDAVKYSATTFSDRFRLGYLKFDADLNRVLTLLRENDLWEDTVIVGYGDHGDELWSHGLNKGYCHAFSPYAILTWTPFFIYDNGLDAGVTDAIASSIDIKETLFRKLLPDYVLPDSLPRFGISPFPGRDLRTHPRQFAFSQNLFALQLELDDPERGLAKGYAVTDGVYRLVASTGGSRPRDGGMELYHDRVDPTNSRNLLDFFRLDPNGDIAAFTPPPEAVSPEFSLLFTPAAVRQMTDAFHTLRRELHDYVRAKEREALQSNNGEHHLMPEEAFKFARKRIRRDYNE